MVSHLGSYRLVNAMGGETLSAASVTPQARAMSFLRFIVFAAATLVMEAYLTSS